MIGNNLLNPFGSMVAPPPQMIGGVSRVGAPVHKVSASPSTVFIGDLPKDVTQIEIFEYLKNNVGGEFELVLKR